MTQCGIAPSEWGLSSLEEISPEIRIVVAEERGLRVDNSTSWLCEMNTTPGGIVGPCPRCEGVEIYGDKCRRGKELYNRITKSQ
jgi:hypothetical protein